MKPFSTTILAAATLLLAGCNSLDSPFGNLFHSTGHDERVYNPQTGQWEWPPEKRAAHEKKSAAVASAMETPGQGFNDTRYWDAQHNQWATASQSRATPTPKPQIAPSAATQLVSSPAQPAPAPPRPQAARATGTYNSKTGKIEWRDSGEYIPPAAPTPDPKKHWYWPF